MVDTSQSFDEIVSKIAEKEGYLGVLLLALLLSDRETLAKQLELLKNNPEALKLLCKKQGEEEDNEC